MSFSKKLKKQTKNANRHPPSPPTEAKVGLEGKDRKRKGDVELEDQPGSLWPPTQDSPS